MKLTIWTGRVEDVLPRLEPGTFDACLCDPPYGLSREPDVAEVMRHWIAGDDYAHGRLRKGEKNCASNFCDVSVVGDAQDGDADRGKVRIPFRVTLVAGPVQIRTVKLDDKCAGWKVEVGADSPGGHPEPLLVDELDAEFAKAVGDGVLSLRKREGATACVGLCRCLADPRQGVGAILVRLRHDAPSEPNGPSGVVARPGAESRAVLTLDCVRRTAELRRAQGADEVDTSVELVRAKCVGARSGTGGLPPVTEPNCAGDVANGAHGTHSIDLLVHVGLLDRVSDPIIRYGGMMSRTWDSFVPGPATWRGVHDALRPGAYLLAFGGTRTYDLLTVAVRFARFEIRDAFAWIYGQGYPKSRNISHDVDALDAVGPRRDRALRFTAWMRTTGVTAAQVNAATDSFMASHFFTEKEQPEIPTPEMFDKIRPLLSAPVPEEIEELIRSRQVESENVKRRPVVSERMGADLLNSRPVSIADQGLEATGRRMIQTTAAFTPLAQRWSGYGTALKPGYEPCVVAMKPLDGTFAANAMKHGVAGLAIDASRIPCSGGSPAAERRATTDVPRNRPDGPLQNRVSAERYREEREGETIGRWPANVVLSHSAACELGLCSPDCPAFVLDAQSGLLESGTMKAGTARSARSARSVCYGAMPETATLTDTPGDAGGASRFFYCAKADTDERHGSRHPTLKPMDLCAYLARMLLPPPRVAGEPPRRILVPFAGAGSEVVGCLRAGWDEVVAVEMDPAFAADIRRRVEREFALLVTIEEEKR